MCSHDYDLFGMFAAENFSNNIRRLNRSLTKCILNIYAQAHCSPSSKKAFELALILCGHIHYGDCEIPSETQYASMSKVHALRLESTLAADDGDGASLLQFILEVSVLIKK